MTVTYTVGNMIDDTIHQLLGSTRTQLNILSADINGTDTQTQISFSQTLQGISGITPGTYLEIDQEEMYVLSINSGAQSALCIRGIPNSTKAAHTAGTLVYINTPFPRWSVAKHLRDEIRSWGPQVFAVKNVDITLNPNVLGYDLGNIAPLFRVMEVSVPPPPHVFGVFDGTQQSPSTPSTNDQSWPMLDFEFRQDAPVNIFPSGKALILKSFNFPWSNASNPQQMHVVYAAPFDVDTSWTETTDAVATIGIDTSDIDIAPIGAAARMMSFREVRRTMTELQGEPREAQEVAALFISRTAAALKQEAEDRLADAQYRLLQRFPVWMSV